MAPDGISETFSSESSVPLSSRASSFHISKGRLEVKYPDYLEKALGMKKQKKVGSGPTEADQLPTSLKAHVFTSPWERVLSL